MEVNIPTRALGKPSPEPTALQFLSAALHGHSFIGLLIFYIHPPQAYSSLVICDEVSLDCEHRSVGQNCCACQQKLHPKLALPSWPKLASPWKPLLLLGHYWWKKRKKRKKKLAHLFIFYLYAYTEYYSSDHKCAYFCSWKPVCSKQDTTSCKISGLGHSLKATVNLQAQSWMT